MKNKDREFLFTSESVSEGHPDKICDQISDVILDAYLEKDVNAKVACETFASPDRIIVGGEITAPEISCTEIENLIRNRIRHIGYEHVKFHRKNIDIENLIIKQSPEIAQGVNRARLEEQGAGDQGIMFGFACSETDSYMPATLYYSHRILHNISDALKAGKLEGLGPDAKSQVTLLYVDTQPTKATSIVVSIQHNPKLSQQDVKKLIRPYVEAAFPSSDWMPKDDEFYVNPTGQFTIGGPESDAGLTGRKIIVDTYGGAAPHGGGAFSGKDPSKVDRSAAYAMRYLAKNIVASGIASKCTLQVSYAIGLAKPLSLYATTHNTSEYANKDVVDCINNIFDLSPNGIVTHLNLKRPIYSKTATYGHFGRAPESDGCFSWEKTDLVKKIQAHFNGQETNINAG